MNTITEYKKWQQVSQNSHEEHLKILFKRKNIASTIILGGHFCSMALYEITLKNPDIRVSKKYYYKAGRSELLRLRLYKGQYPNLIWPSTKIPSFVATFISGLMPIVLSDSKELLEEFLKEIERLPYERYKNKEDIAICYAAKYLLLG